MSKNNNKTTVQGTLTSAFSIMLAQALRERQNTDAFSFDVHVDIPPLADAYCDGNVSDITSNRVVLDGDIKMEVKGC